MKTVRLPIYEDGVELREYLEVDLTFFISAAASKFKANPARVIALEDPVADTEVSDGPLADWEKELLWSEEVKPEYEWRELDGLPTKSFQINEKGDIRHKVNQKIISPSLDLDSPFYLTVNLLINGINYWVDGPRKAEEIFGKRK